MTDAINAVLSFFQAILAFGKNFLEGTYAVLTIIPRAVTFLIGTIGYVPSAIAIFAIFGISISIVLLILGR